MGREKTLDVTKIDAQKQEWTCPACEEVVSFQHVACRCGYDARPFLQRMSRFAPREKQKARKRVSAGFVFSFATLLGWMISTIALFVTFGTIAMLPPALAFGFFSLVLIARDSWKQKKRKKVEAAAELADMAKGLLALAEEHLAGSKRR